MSALISVFKLNHYGNYQSMEEFPEGTKNIEMGDKSALEKMITLYFPEIIWDEDEGVLNRTIDECTYIGHFMLGEDLIESIAYEGETYDEFSSRLIRMCRENKWTAIDPEGGDGILESYDPSDE